MTELQSRLLNHEDNGTYYTSVGSPFFANDLAGTLESGYSIALLANYYNFFIRLKPGIPPGSVINSAYFDLLGVVSTVAIGTGPDPIADIYVELGENVAPPRTYEDAITRTISVDSVMWQPPSGTNDVQTASLTALLQQAIDQPGWTVDSYVTFHFRRRPASGGTALLSIITVPSYDGDPLAVTLRGDFTAPEAVATPSVYMPAIIDPFEAKDVLVHVYDEDGNYIRTLPDWSTFPSYRWGINGGPSTLSFDLARATSDFSAGELDDGGQDDLALGALYKLYVVDRESQPDGVLIYQGALEHYEVDRAARLINACTLIPKTSLIGDRFLRGPLTLTDTDPTQMMKYFVDNGYLPGVEWDTSNPDVGQLYSATFESQKLSQVFESIQRLAGGKWYYRFNPDNTLTFNHWDSNAPDHVLYIGRHVTADVRYVRSRVDVKKKVYVFGKPEQRDDNGVLISAAVEATAEVPGYDPTVEPRDLFYANPRIADYQSARRVARALLEQHQAPTIETQFTVMDSNVDPRFGYDLESLKPGQVVSLRDPAAVFAIGRWGTGNSVWGDGSVWGGYWYEQVQKGLVIAEVDYRYTTAIVKLVSRPVQLAEETVGISDRVLLLGG